MQLQNRSPALAILSRNLQDFSGGCRTADPPLHEGILAVWGASGDRTTGQRVSNFEIACETY